MTSLLRPQFLRRACDTKFHILHGLLPSDASPLALLPRVTDPTGARRFFNAPIGVVNTFGKIAVRRRPRPINHPLHQPVFDRVVMNVMEVRLEVTLVPDAVFPKPALPHRIPPCMHSIARFSGTAIAFSVIRYWALKCSCVSARMAAGGDAHYPLRLGSPQGALEAQRETPVPSWRLPTDEPDEHSEARNAEKGGH